MLQHNPAVLPRGKVSTVPRADAEQMMAKFEYARQQLLDVIQNCCHSTAVPEPGAKEDNAVETMRHVDWTRSNCVPSDSHLSDVNVLSRDLHHKLDSAANVAVACDPCANRRSSCIKIKKINYFNILTETVRDF
jgi:hypothetical protein